MKEKAGKITYETLREYGVTHLFGLEDPVPLYQALDKKVIQPITIRNEKHGAIMAHGYAKATNKPGVCTAIYGPGAINLMTGLAEALKSSTPVIALIQDTASTSRWKNASMEIDHEPLLRSVVKWVVRVDNPNRFAEMTRKAFRLATSGRPGPVALVCPGDIMGADAEEEVYAEPGCGHYPSMRVRASREAIEAAAEVMATAKKPVIIAGGGSILSQAWDQVVELAEMYQIPVATTIMGKGTIPDAHPLSLGVMGNFTGGTYGRGKIANQIVSEADVAFIMGSRTDQYPYFNWTLPKKGTKVIHLDMDPEEIGRNFESHVALVGDVRETLMDFIEHCRGNQIKITSQIKKDQIDRLKEEWLKLNEPLLNSEAIPIRPERLIKEISEYVTEDTIVTTDASYVGSWAASHIDNVTKGCNFIIPRAMAGLGWGLPAAMGAKVGRPEKTVFCFTGDGAFGYVMNELETAARYNIGVITVVFNNNCWGFQKHYEEMAFGKSVECELLDVDYSSVARALKCNGERLKDPKEIKGALERAVSANGPYVIDVMMDPDVIAPLAMFDGFDPAKKKA